MRERRDKGQKATRHRARKMQTNGVLEYVLGPKGKREKKKESRNESSVPEL
jgi:hypothetical protein